jgi:hypothetical protein
MSEEEKKTPKTGSKRAPYVDQETFVRIHEESSSLDEVAKRTGLSKQAICTRASIYRNRFKIPLQKWSRSRKPVSVEPLRKLALQIQEDKKK